MEFSYISTLTTIIATCTMATLVVGYGRALISRRGVVFHLVVSICLIYISYILRTIYWDMIFVPNTGMLSRAEINPFFDSLAIWGGMHGHVAIYLMIPDVDRTRWTRFTAWLYPPFLVTGVFKRMLRWLFS